MTIDYASASLRPRPSPLSWALNPYLLILVGALLDSTGEVLLAKGAKGVVGTAFTSGVFGWMGPLASGWTWIGIISYILSLLSWLYVLRHVPLSVAFPLINVVHVLVPTGAHFFLHESIPLRLWLGVGMILSGVLVIARPLMAMEEKL